MNTITVTVYQDNSGYHESGYPKAIPVAGLNVIGREIVQYGAAPECNTDPAQPSRVLLHISGPGIGNLWVDESQASITDKINGECCDGGGGSSAGSIRVVLSSGDLTAPGGNQRITRTEFLDKAMNGILINDGTTKVRGIGYTKTVGNSYLDFTDGTTLNAGDTIVFI